MSYLKKYKVFLLILTISVAVLIFVLFRMNFSLVFTENTGFYFYSTLIQSNAAIISIFGLFYIFKLQSIRSTIEEHYNSMIGVNIIVNEEVRKYRFSTMKEKKEIIDNYPKNDDVLQKYIKYYSLEESIVDIKQKMKFPTIAIIILISFETLFLLICSSIHNLGSFYEFIVFSVVLIFQVYILIVLGKAIIDVAAPE